MASMLNEYISKRLGVLDLQNELSRLIKLYNNKTGRYMFVYAADINKARNGGVDVSMVQDDFYTIQDILRESTEKKIDFYIETPGGSGESAEEIAKYLRKKFDEVNFVIAGEAKSAGTILVLSGDNIYMTETGSLGPIDAQVKIGRSVISAHDYKEWVDLKIEEATQKGRLNSFDAAIVSQISPGEIRGIVNSLEFAKDLVKEWLELYKFKNWTVTETTKTPVTLEYRKQRANEVAEILCNHTTWRSHGRSLKIEDLSNHLLIERIEDDPKLADIVYRIKTVIRLIFDGSTIYKLFSIDNFRITKTYTVTQGGNQSVDIPIPSVKGQQNLINGVNIDIKCPRCAKAHKVKGYLDVDSQQIKSAKLPVNENVIDNDIFVCDNCKFALDLKLLKNQLESQIKRKITFK